MVFAMMILSCQTLWGRAGQHRTCPARAPPPLLAQQTHSLKDGYDDLHDDDEDHDDEDDDVDEDLIEGDIEQGSSSEALQNSNGKQMTPTRLK